MSFRRALGIVGGFVIAASTGCANLADRLILYPSRRPIETYGAQAEIFSFPEGDLEIWRAQSRAAAHRPPEAYLLTFWGNGDRADGEVGGIVDSWGQQAVEIWGLNYPGFGRSSGTARLDKMPRAAEHALDLIQKAAHGRPVILFGASLGTAVALHLAATRHLDGLILNNPPPLRQLILGRFGWWNFWLLAKPVAAGIPPELDSIQNARSARAPAVFFLSEKDRLVLPKYHHMVADAYAGPKQIRLLPGAGHYSPISGPNLTNALTWLIAHRRGNEEHRR